MEWIIKCFKQYVDFNGRARRKEFWMFYLFTLVLSFVTLLIGVDILTTICSLAVFIPGIAVGVRRMHDIDKSGWWYLINLIPLIGNIWFIILAAQDSKPGVNPYGPNPKGF